MRGLLHLASRFRRDDRGAFAVIFAVMAIVLLAMSGAAVDFGQMQEARTRGQVALDAAAVALEPDIYGSSSSAAQQLIQQQAQTLLLNRLAEGTNQWSDCTTNNSTPPCAHVQTPTIDVSSGQLGLQATLKVPMTFVSLVGVTSASPSIVSVASRGTTKLEVALVLGDSSTMGYTMGYNQTISGNTTTRAVALNAAASCAVNILFYNVPSCAVSTSGLVTNPNVKMAVVPFATAVNVGAANASAAWLDRTGPNNAITLMHFDNDDNPSTAFSGGVDRIALFSNLNYQGKAMSWRGCVEARVNNGADEQYDTDDTLPDQSKPDTLFTPFFSPDDPGPAGYYNYGYNINGQWFGNTYISDSCAGKSNSSNNNVLEQRLCKYSVSGGAAMGSDENIAWGYGPNGFCLPYPITPLTNLPDTVKAALAMSPNGSTSMGISIAEGVVWGFRVLSPTAPFTEGAPYSSATHKAIVVVTDNENSATKLYGNINGSERYSAYGYPADGRLGPASSDPSVYRSRLNDRLSATCTNAKANGIAIYIIGVDMDATSDPTGNRSLLTNCASDPTDAYFTNSSDGLQAAFLSIAGSLNTLSIIQ